MTRPQPRSSSDRLSIVAEPEGPWLLQAARTIAEDAGRILAEEFRTGSRVRSSVGKDIKLEADLRAEKSILARLRQAADIPILSEESGADPEFHTAGEYWVVDPLDGTLNLHRRIPLSCVSIALWRGDKPVFGVVHDFLRGRLSAVPIPIGPGATVSPSR